MEIEKYFYIPNYVKLKALNPNEMTKPTEGMVAYTSMLKSGVNLPFHPYMHYILRSLDVALTQVNLTIYKVIMIWKYSGIKSNFSFVEFKRLYQIKSVATGSSWYHLASWFNVDYVIPSDFFTQIKG